MREAIYGFDDAEHYRNHIRIRNPYTNTVHYTRRRKKVTWNPYTKRQSVSYATHLPTAVNKTGHPLTWSQLTSRQRRQFRRPEKLKKTSLQAKEETVQKTRYTGFKRAFNRWMNGELSNILTRANTPAWMKGGGYKPRMLLPQHIRTFLYKARLRRDEIAQFSAWLKHEKAPHGLREYLFYAHYNKPVPFEDGSLPAEHEYFKFEEEIKDFEYDPHASFKDLTVYDTQRPITTGSLFKFKSGNQPTQRRYGSVIQRRRLRPAKDKEYLFRRS